MTTNPTTTTSNTTPVVNSGRSNISSTNTPIPDQLPTRPSFSIEPSRREPDNAYPSSTKGTPESSPCRPLDVEGKGGQQPSTLPFSKARSISLVATVTGAGFMNTLSIQATVIILPTIGEDLNIPDSRLQWIVSAYALTFGCFLLLWGRIADIYGKRLIFIWGSIWVTAVTLANPFVKNEIVFNLFRGLQGLGAAANVPTAIGILGTTFPPGKAKNYAFSTYAAGAPLGSIFGNLLAGFIAAYTSWIWVFIAMGSFSAIIALAGYFVIPPPNSTLHSQGIHAKTSVDWIGAFLITAGLLSLMFALTQGNVVGWSTPWIPVLIVVSVILIAMFVFWQRHLEKKCAEVKALDLATEGGTATTGSKNVQQPLMKVSIFHRTRFSAAMAIMVLFFGSFNNFLIYCTYFYQEYQGLDTLQTTLRFIPTGVVGVITAFIVAHLLSRVPTFALLFFGNVSSSIANLLFAVPISPDRSYFSVGLIAMTLSVFGADTTWPSLTLYTSASLPHEDQALGGALINAVGQFGRAIGLAVATAVQTAVMARERRVEIEDAGALEEWDEASLLGLRAASWFNFGLGVAALGVITVFFRGNEVVGRVGTEEGEKNLKVEQRGRGGGEEGVMNEEDSN